VVLQDQSLGPVEHRERLNAYARKFDEAIREAGARTCFYLTWARQARPEMQAALDEAYLGIALELGARLAPVGPAWQKAFARSPGLVLHTEDGSHPNALGSYIAACVFFSTLYGRSAEGLGGKVVLGGEPVMEIDANDAALAQRVAWAAVKETEAGA
jgi:hypothetical protein